MPPADSSDDEGEGGPNVVLAPEASGKTAEFLSSDEEDDNTRGTWQVRMHTPKQVERLKRPRLFVNQRPSTFSHTGAGLCE